MCCCAAALPQNMAIRTAVSADHKIRLMILDIGIFLFFSRVKTLFPSWVWRVVTVNKSSESCADPPSLSTRKIRTPPRPAFSRPVQPNPDEHQRPAAADDFEDSQQLVWFVRRRQDREGDGERCSYEAHDRERIGRRFSAGHSNYSFRDRFALQLKHGRK